MKKALIAIAVVLVIAIGAMIYLASNANTLIAKYKPDLEKIASSALGSSVTLGKLEAEIFPSAKIRVDEFRIARTPDAKEGLSLKNLLLHIRLLPLLSGNLNIVKLGLDSPQLTFLKDKNGVSIEGLPKAAPQAQAASAPAAAAPAAAGSQAGPVPAGLGLNLEKFELKNARIILKDLDAQKEFTVSNINVDAAVAFENNVAKVQSLAVNGRALDKIDFEVTGKPITYSLADGRFDLSNLTISVLGGNLDIQASGAVPAQTGKAHIDSSGFDLSKLSPAYDIVPALKDFALQGKVRPRIDAEWGPHGSYKAVGTVGLESLGATAAGVVVSALKGQINLDATQVAQKANAKDLTMNLGAEPATLSFDAQVANNQAELQKLTVSVFGGTVDATAGVGMTDQRFTSKYALKGLAIDRAVSVLMPSMGALVSGTVEDVSGNVAGALGPNLKQSMTGSTSVLVKDGAIKGVNIAADVLKAVKDLPFLAGSLFSAAPPGQQAALAAADTPIKELKGTFNIANAALTTNDFLLSSSIFSMAARGSMGFDAKVDLNAQISFDETLSGALVLKVPQLKSIQDSRGRVELPLMLQGTAPKILILPDVQKILELAASAAVKEGANKLLDQVLGGGGNAGKKKGLGGLLGF